MTASELLSSSIESDHVLPSPQEDVKLDSEVVDGLTVVGRNSRFGARGLEDAFIYDESVSSSASHCSDMYESASANNESLLQDKCSSAKEAAATLKAAKMFLYARRDDHEGRHFDFLVLKKEILVRRNQGKDAQSGGTFVIGDGGNAKSFRSVTKESTATSSGRWRSEKFSYVHRVVSKFVHFRRSG